MDKHFQTTHDITYPEIFLAIDNCFASKRYTEPDEWMSLIKDMGINYVEASADTESDPLYQGKDYLRRWVDKVKEASEKTGVSVCNLYSGHGTYSTLGLSHTDPMVRERILNKWLKPMVETAATLNAGLGFFCHAFANLVLQQPVLFQEYKNELINNLAEVSRFSRQMGCKTVGVEQMYSPHQVPWTIEEAKEMIYQVTEKSANPFYITIDTGHQSGQRNFLKPTEETLIRALEQYRKEGHISQIWLGSDSTYKLFEGSQGLDNGALKAIVKQIFDDMDNYPYLFAKTQDGSVYTWLKELACYSPIIHLQQTDGKSSGHWPFTASNNEKGIIEGKKVLEAIKASFENQQNHIIPKVDKIYLTIEVFASTASINYDTLDQLKETILYWRQFIPVDGIKLDELC